MTNKLTTKTYWETYYGAGSVDKKNIISTCSYYDEYWDLFIDSSSENQTIIEIGGFPGRYLAYLSAKYNLLPTSLDYNSDQQKIKDSFAVMDVKEYLILQKDFTSFIPSEEYDYVLSNGFIEHFTNFDEILDLHINYVKKGGRLYVMIPNMKGYIRFYKYLVDYQNLKIHNLNSMHLKVFKDFAQRNNLKIIHLSYFGDFPHKIHQEANLFQKIIFKTHRLMFKRFLNKFINKYPSKYFSGGIVAIFEN